MSIILDMGNGLVHYFHFSADAAISVDEPRGFVRVVDKNKSSYFNLQYVIGACPKEYIHER